MFTINAYRLQNKTIISYKFFFGNFVDHFPRCFAICKLADSETNTQYLKSKSN